ncbi:JAB1/Mov34/MPN/PAD-1 ubiquitin protease [Kordia sp. SMS9]|uniref:Mov34/MPN/PAD-1 family protein n=1 Tax=Kordia sp. SMS9 TaxID=2282170 RepID=UPI000E0D1572|nr:Mov34/MPN/PAD-1 family protein [Kordia sp. SMS9]AXG72384.1 JAB1/Mov34/MPN/PAD-1 ubiquitin protease [Kordia sp. SMS9]
MNKKFSIHETVSEYIPKLLEKNISLEKNDEYDSDIQKLGTLNEIFLSQKAKETIFGHIDWNKDTANNSVEQGGLLIGHSYEDKKKKRIIGYAKNAIPALTAKGSMAYLKFDHHTWKLMMDNLDAMNDDSEKNEELQVIGWYHTHPGRLSVFMSGTDLHTQRTMFSKDWQFAIVLNPQKQIWRAFSGLDAKECNGYILKS